MTLAILDGTLLPAGEARIPVTDDGLLRGDGVFEAVRLYGGRPFALDDHLERMAGSAAGLRLALDLDALRADIAALLEAAGSVDAALRIVATRGGRRLVLLEELPVLPPAVALAAIEYVPSRVLDRIKSLSYAGNMLADRLAVERGADRALLVTPHGRVLEAPTSTFFCSLDGETLVTPPLSERILDSITRRRLLALIDVREAPIVVDELAGAREAFLASTLREVHPVRAIDGRALPAVPGPLTTAAAGAFRAHVAAELEGGA